MSSKSWLPWAALGVVYVVWGSTYLAMRFMVESMPPLFANGFRFILAGVLLATIVALVSGVAALRMTWPQVGTAVLVGILLPAWGTGLIVLAASHVASGLTALLIACVPLYVVVLRRLFGDRPAKVTYIAVGVGLVGLVVLLLGGPVEGAHGSSWFGPWLVLLGALGWAVGSVLSTRLPVPANPFTLSAIEMLAGGVVLCVVGLGAGEKIDIGTFTTGSWVAWFYLLTFGSVLAFSSYVFILGRLPVSTVATYAYVNPVIAVFLGYLLANERFGVAQLIGGVIVLAAVVLVVRSEQRPKQVAVAPEPVEAIR
ncbi:MAG: EamA family transporter [Actinomycetota bacterium]|nr:EamA family transporter [Actinomycetota bacterium]